MRVCSHKKCKHQGKPQPESNFHKKKSSISGYQAQCKDCKRIYDKISQERIRNSNDWLKIIIG